MKYIHIGNEVLKTHKILNVSWHKRTIYWNYPYRLTIKYAKSEKPVYVGIPYFLVPVNASKHMYHEYKFEKEADARHWHEQIIKAMNEVRKKDVIDMN